jgi:hypothetical protein
MDRFVAFLRGMNIFASDGEESGELAARIESGLGEALGYEVPVFLRNADELRAIAEYESFEARLVEESAGKVQVAFLLYEPKASARMRCWPCRRMMTGSPSTAASCTGCPAVASPSRNSTSTRSAQRLD